MLFQIVFAVNSRRAIVSSVLLGLAPLLAGCGGGTGVERLPVHGTVTFPNGEKPDCSITFLPAKGRPGPSATTRVVGGRYKFDRNNGPAAGPHSVMLTRLFPRSGTIPTADKKASAGMKTEWTESADVLDDGQYEQDFTLKD